MAIGTAAAIGLGVAGVGAALGARSSSKAAGKAADTSLAVAQQNNALAREIYDQNSATLNPFVDRGNEAGNAINSLLGISGGDNPQADYNNALENFRSSTGFDFRQQEGNNALNTGYAASGALRSGAAQKSFADYNQNIASNEFGNYIGQLGNQQNLGLGAASAQAGVGQNFSNTFSANNNAAGTSEANALWVKGQNNPFASALGTVGGFASSFGG